MKCLSLIGNFCLKTGKSLCALTVQCQKTHSKMYFSRMHLSTPFSHQELNVIITGNCGNSTNHLFARLDEYMEDKSSAATKPTSIFREGMLQLPDAEN